EDVMTVGIRSLLLDTPTSTSLPTGSKRYYRIQVGANLDLLVNLASGNNIARNEFYIAYNRIPTTNDFDAKGNLPQQKDQYLIVPETQGGYYYLMVTSSYDGGSQEVTLLAKALPFSITRVNPGRVGKGLATTRVEGAGFKEGVQFKLRTGNTDINTAIITGVARVNSMQALVAWDL